MFTQAIVIAALVGATALMTKNRTRGFDRGETGRMSDYAMYRQDHRETGISWGTQRTQDHSLNNLNEAYKPRSGPMQESTHDLDLVYSDQADIDAWVNEYSPQFFFMRNPTVPLAANQQGAMNIEIPMEGQSFRGDHSNSLAHFPRVYADCVYASDNKSNKTFTGFKGTMAAEEPTEWEEMYVPDEGTNNAQYNPWGPGGVIQNIYNKQGAMTTRRRGANRAEIGLPSRLSRRVYNLNDTYPRN